MAKKKRKRRPPTRPVARTEIGPARAERKEEARKEREARIRRARRRVWLRRLTRVGIVILLGALIAFFVVWSGRADRRLQEAAAAAAESLGCTDIQDLPDEGREHLVAGEPPPDYETTPATSGKHNGATLPADQHVYDQPFDANIEAQAVHNLEHGYVLIYYKQDGPEALSKNVVESLGDLARSEDKVILAPHPELPEGQSLALAAWTHLQTCPNVTDANRAVALIKGFINSFRGTAGDAPEANRA
jgi:hypothetical protein